ncbi:universal stress protein UspA [Tenacibaculum holothuriorum]|uniref:Universal stress protein UspA n=1 Tax=Tenacibaculum holothuriorum TaxID=1635173 RepID=A0A1Y2PDW4_9FLAO|nr:universal stress protein [Tenacibaculum holothuriorum]OSY87987.1 universal stress protein UspA [Tenacibaculum holothuriorum]
MKKIIVPVDFSDYSERALQTAAFFAKEQNAEIVVVHMLELSNAVINQSQSYIQEEAVFYMKLAEKRFKEFLNKPYLEGIKITPIIKHFKIFSELDVLAREEEADLIIMGSKGTSGMQEIFVGSNTEKVIRHSKTPVLVIKEEAITSSLKKAAFACDFSDDDIDPLLKAEKLFSTLKCPLELVYVRTPYVKFKSTKELNERIKLFLHKLQDSGLTEDKIHVVSEYSIEEGLRYFVTQENVDVLVVATHGKKGFTHFFEGSISEDVANHSNFPVLSFKI